MAKKLSKLGLNEASPSGKFIILLESFIEAKIEYDAVLYDLKVPNKQRDRLFRECAQLKNELIGLFDKAIKK